MPALVKSNVGSLAGTSDELRTIRWLLAAKKLRNVSRISFPVMYFYCDRCSGIVTGAELSGFVGVLGRAKPEARIRARRTSKRMKIIVTYDEPCSRMADESGSASPIPAGRGMV